ncbi:hypothetical protein [Salipiger sp.]|uniref:hypothetical protein n=1 Tax=Salipiger sp. TaxID=2078585 RepID=UPI003A972E5E
MDIFSKRDGPRREDVQAKRLISENSHVIKKLADQISGGGYTAMQQTMAKAKETPKPDGLLIHDLGRSRGAEAPRPYVKVSMNNRVVLADLNSGRQIQLLGEIRGNFSGRRFVLATAENGFYSPVEGEMLDALRPLDGTEIHRGFDDKALAEAIGTELGLQ